MLKRQQNEKKKLAINRKGRIVGTRIDFRRFMFRLEEENGRTRSSGKN
jgi:hypothetical protein